MDGIREVCKELGITLNEKKTQIVKLTHGFKYLKTRFYLLDSCKIVRKIHKKSITRQRRKLKKFKVLLDRGIMTYEDVYTSWQSWKSYANTFSAWRTVQNMARLYDELFIIPWLNGQTN